MRAALLVPSRGNLESRAVELMRVEMRGGLLNPHSERHCMRVLRNAKRLTQALQEANPNLHVDEDVVTVASLFHDLGRRHTGSEEHGAESAQAFLMDGGIFDRIGFPADDARRSKVLKAIARHDVTVMPHERVSIEEKIVYDADKMDAFGWIGILRHVQHFIFRERQSPAVGLESVERRFSGLSFNETRALVSKDYKLARGFFLVLTKLAPWWKSRPQHRRQVRQRRVSE